MGVRCSRVARLASDVRPELRPKPFAPSFTSGLANPFAGQYSPFVSTLTRADGMPYLQRIETALPTGMPADISSVPRCDQDPASAGS